MHEKKQNRKTEHRTFNPGDGTRLRYGSHGSA